MVCTCSSKTWHLDIITGYTYCGSRVHFLPRNHTFELQWKSVARQYVLNPGLCRQIFVPDILNFIIASLWVISESLWKTGLYCLLWHWLERFDQYIYVFCYEYFYSVIELDLHLFKNSPVLSTLALTQEIQSVYSCFLLWVFLYSNWVRSISRIFVLSSILLHCL